MDFEEWSVWGIKSDSVELIHVPCDKLVEFHAYVNFDELMSTVQNHICEEN